MITRDDARPHALDWLIVGGGIHGVHLAVRLLHAGAANPDRLRIVDPAPRLLERFWSGAAVTGMTYLRSPSVHHLDVGAMSLRRFAARKMKNQSGIFARPYDRPSVALFRAHCDHVIERFGLERLHTRDRVTRCRVQRRGAAVQLAGGAEIAARRVVLAIGAGDQPLWPDWAPRHDARIQHVFAPDSAGWPPPGCGAVAVVGGGISAAQVAVRLVAEGRRVALISRHALRERQFDSDPGWLGPKRMAGFERTRDLELRRAIVDEARHRGSVPPDVRQPLERALARGQVAWHESEVAEVAETDDGLLLRLENGSALGAHRVLLATGFASERPGGQVVDELIASARLACAPCGYPIVDSALRWHPRIFVSGPLAELEVGPVARTIAGARRAAERVLEGLGKDAACARAPRPRSIAAP